MMMVMTVMMMVIVSRMLLVLNVAVDLAALLALVLKLKRRVRNSVLGKLLADLCFYLTVISRNNNVHSRVYLMSIGRTDVNVMNVKHAVNVAYMLLDLIYMLAHRILFKEKLKHDL